MEDNFAISKLSDADLFQEHDLLKTIWYKSQYYEPNEEIQVYFDDFNDKQYFKHLSDEIDLNRIERIILRLKPYNIINKPNTIARLNKGWYCFAVDRSLLEEVISLIDVEIELRTKRVSIKKVEFNNETGEAKFYIYGKLIRSCFFQKNTNEYQLFSYFIQNNNKQITSQDLIPLLKEIRAGVEGEDNKRRVKDTITAIRAKLSKDIIETVANGLYKYDGEVTYL